MKPLRIVLFAAVLLAVLFMLVAVTASAAPPNRPFVGAWEATDIFDGSHERASIGGGGNGQYHVRGFDDGASVCGLDASGEPLYAAIAIGTGNAVGNELHADLTLWCLSHPRAFHELRHDNIIYDPLNDTLSFWGVIWHRTGP